MWRSKQEKIWCNSEFLVDKGMALFACTGKKYGIFNQGGIKYKYKTMRKYGTRELGVRITQVP